MKDIRKPPMFVFFVIISSYFGFGRGFGVYFGVYFGDQRGFAFCAGAGDRNARSTAEKGPQSNESYERENL